MPVLCNPVKPTMSPARATLSDSVASASALIAGLSLSTIYLGWGVIAQQIAGARAANLLANAGVRAERLLAQPTPFNSLLWRVIAVDGARYLNLYVPLLGTDERIAVFTHPRLARVGCTDSLDSLAKLAQFTDGFYRVDVSDGELAVSDLRMGLTPDYVFRFVIARARGEAFDPVPPRRLAVVRNVRAELDWLRASLGGIPAVRPAEAGARIEASRLAASSGASAGARAC